MTHVAVGILRMNDKILICQRKQGGRYPLKWEFPGGKIEAGETVLDCLKRELWEELSVGIRSVERVDYQTAHYDDGGKFRVAYCYISDFVGDPKNNVFETIRWVRPEELPSIDMLEGNKDIVRQLAGKQIRN